MAEAFIYDAVRTPRGKGKKDGSLHATRPITLGKTVLEAIRDRNQLDTANVKDIIFGCVTPIGEQGGDVAKTCAFAADYAESVPAVTLNRFCSSGLEAVNQASAYVMSGMTDLIVAGGVEAMSRIPLGSDGGAWVIDPEMASKTHFVPQGISADLIATLYGYSRNDVDEFAVNSQKKAGQAWEEKRFAGSVVPVKDSRGNTILDFDELMRADTTVDGLAKLKPAFKEMGESYGFDAMAMGKYPQVESIEHVHHAGNSSGIVDGAAAVLIGNKEIGDQLNLKRRAKIKSFAVTSTEPTIMLTGPGPSSKMALEKAGMTVGDIDLFEVNEAFASVVLKFIDEVGADPDKINVNGGAIAMGHPLGATGAMLLGTLVDELERQNKSTGLVTLCVGGGMGVATIIERI